MSSQFEAAVRALWSEEFIRFPIYAMTMSLIWAAYWTRRLRQQRRTVRMLETAVAAGLSDPPSLHPVINEAHCIGCRSCVTACPEGDVLGVIDGKARLVNPSHCIGHGACKRACPMNAIDLVFGTERRGVDIPFVSSEFETNVPGVFIAGELGGMGLIRNAAEQGQQAITAIAERRDKSGDAELDVLIVGAGPAGIAASLAAAEKRLRYVTIEQEVRGGTVAHYPRGKIVMTEPVNLPLVGKTRLRETTKEALLAFWEAIEKEHGLSIHYAERLESIIAERDGFLVRTSSAVYRARAVLLAIGRRGSPRKLDVPGEEVAKVVYRLIDAAQYDGKHVLVVGGGDSAIEAAVSLSERPGTQVTLSYRGAAFSRTREKNRQLLAAAAAKHRLSVVLESSVREILAADVILEHHGAQRLIPNDAVIVCAGGILPTQLLKDIGVRVETKYGTA